MVLNAWKAREIPAIEPKTVGKMGMKGVIVIYIYRWQNVPISTNLGCNPVQQARFMKTLLPPRVATLNRLILIAGLTN